MRAKQYFYVCAGILLLVIDYSVGARTAIAQGGRTIRAQTNPVGDTYFLTSDTHIFALGQNGWVEVIPTDFPPGVAREDIDYFGFNWVVTKSGVGWTIERGSPGNPWINHGPLPGIVSVAGTSWSAMKNGFRK